MEADFRLGNIKIAILLMWRTQNLHSLDCGKTGLIFLSYTVNLMYARMT